MSKQYSSKRRLKYVFLALACTASFTLTGMVTACSSDSDTDETEKTTSVEDKQLLKNGNFEYFTVPDGDNVEYLIKTPTNWTSGGSSSYTMSGIISTSADSWTKLTDENLKATLDANNELDEDDDDYEDEYVDYNGMKSQDILYKDTYKALNTDDDDDDYEEAIKLIENPGTHYNVQEKSDGSLYYMDGTDEVAVYVNDDGDYFLDEDYTQGISNILMLHNYATAHNGIAQNYSSVSVDLPANTAAEISLWVKTAYLKYNQGATVEQDRGASITVTQTAGSNSLDDFTISSINTEKLISANAVESSNGWVQYTVYVNACDFADTTISLQLALGETDETVEGYAFFDDVQVTKYISLDDTSYSESVVGSAKCSLSDEGDSKVFKADKYERNIGSSTEAVSSDRYSKFTHYLIDLASEEEYQPVSINKDNSTIGLTVDSDNYVTSTISPSITLGSDLISLKDIGDAKLTSAFKKLTNGLSTSKDLLAVLGKGEKFSGSQYSEQINEAIATASDLPKYDDASSKTIVMLSAYGASYNTSINLELGADTRKIISFWVKTSDMNGSTAATLTVTQVGKKSNTSNFTIDSTDITTDIDDDNEDIYNGWVQCFLFVSNETENDENVTIDFSFGNTTIKDTAESSFSGGWVALTNMQYLSVDEETYALTGSNTYMTTLTISESESGTLSSLDTPYGSQSNEIKNTIVPASTYTGVNGSSSTVVKNESISLPYDDINTNDNAGLINKEYFENYASNFAEGSCSWYGELLSAFGVTNTSTTNAINAWNSIFGTSSAQPIVIVNKLRDYYVANKGADETTYKNYYIKNEDGEYEKVASDAAYDENETYYSLMQAMNYGFVGTTSTLAADSYAIVSVRVRVSDGAVAYVYLTDGTADKNILSFSAPKYTFLYDSDGNVLKEELDDDATLAEQRANIVYSLRDDGLYDGTDANGVAGIYANIYNYSNFIYSNNKVKYYDENGNEVDFEDLDSSVIYYSDAAHTTRSDCYIVTTSGVKVYEIIDGTIYYRVDGETTSTVVLPFDTQYAKYSYSDINNQYVVKIDGSVQKDWVNVTFALHSGSESKTYRLELWSGRRDQSGTADTDDKELSEGSVVLFDYTYDTVTEDTFDTVKSYYETQIISSYQNILAGKVDFDTSEENISYYEGLAASEDLSDADKAAIASLKQSYLAHYYTYTLYDSADFQPFNAETADDGETGYDYSYTDYEETLAYLQYQTNNTYTVFVDYSTIDQSISLVTASDDEDEDDDDDDDTDGTTVWLLVSSIILVVVLLFTMASIFIRDLVKKMRRKKVTAKNTYQQRNRYIRKLHIKKDEYEEVENPALKNDSAEESTPVEETPVDAVEETPVEPAEETTAEPTEETPAETETSDTTDSSTDENKD
jgi:hypothetical protein